MNVEIQEQLTILHQKIRFLGKTKLEDHIAALNKIAKLGSPFDAQYIFSYIFSENEAVAQTASTAIAVLLTKPEAEKAWLHLYESLSNTYLSDRILNATGLERLSTLPAKEAVHLLGITSMSYNGYARQAALEQLTKLNSPKALPYMLLRLNDWVPQVRNAAEKALDTLLPIVSVMELVKYHSLIEWLGRTKRVQLADIQQRILKQIPRSREELLSYMQHAPVKERIFCWKALADEAKHDSLLLDKAIDDSAAEVRQWAISILPDDTRLHERLLKLLLDKAIRVRYAALKSLPASNYSNFESFFKNALFDDSRPIRDYAQFVMRKLGYEPLAERYREQLQQSTKPLAGVIAGLGETGDKQDITLLLSYADHKNPRIRAAVLAGLNRLKAEDTARLCLLGLQDQNAKVRSISAAILASGYADLKAQLEEVLWNGHVKAQKAALKVLMHYGTLESLLSILFALTQPSESLREVAWRYLTTWYNQNAIKLWFTFSDSTYDAVNGQIELLKQANVSCPPYASIAWGDLPTIMQALKQKPK